uniref:Myb-like DNA-binding domain-containing protein n=1 Tax=Trepomonas sp. PC1 TaxID=1076344 RepID=A0A146K3X8_9EUKA|eukprot:JAP91603.1 Myb-like DNA-binding domain-containing protein [Trepomonas sp. PC1]
MEQMWSQEKTQQLLYLVQEHTNAKNKTNWELVASQMGGVTLLQCKQHYVKNYVLNISADEKYHEWTDLEKDLLLDCVQLYGKDWDRIQHQCFGWMTPIKLKNKHYAIMKLREEHEHQLQHQKRVEMRKHRNVQYDDEVVYKAIRQILQIE